MQECLGVDAAAGRLLELNARRSLKLAEVSQDRALDARHIALRIVVV